MKLHESLKNKGWSDEEINKTIKIIDDAKTKKHKWIRFFEKEIYWTALSVIILGNYIISLIIIPLLLALDGLKLYFSIMILGFSFGLLIELLIRSIAHLERKHHMFLGLIIPSTALTNIILITIFANSLEKDIMINNMHNPILVSVVYTTAFMLPYAFYQIFIKE